MIIKNNSNGYGYKYASLSDIAEQGVELPKMKTGTENGREYIFYYDTDLKDWVRGAAIVVPENKGMNAAQLYASAVTYARRVTVQLARSLACSDDAIIEDTTADGDLKTEPKATEKQVNYIKQLYSPEKQAEICKYYKVDQLTELSMNDAKKAIETALKRNEEHN